MLDLGSVCYLDLQKTGSTFVVGFLRRHCRGREVGFERHGVVAAARPGTTYVVSVRDPVDLYRSLYAYGVEGGGKVRARLAKHGDADVYDGTPAGFAAWLDIVLDPANHTRLEGRYKAHEAALYGFQTYRLLRLSFANSPEPQRGFRSRDDVRAAYATHRLPSVVLRNETLNADLARLIDSHLAPLMDDPAAAKAELAGTPKRVNASANSAGGIALPIGPETAAKIAEREWFFAEALGYALSPASA